MFWKYHTGTVSHVDTLLDKEGVTLTEILEQEDIIQECKSQNKKLVDFLTKQEVLSELLDLILQEPAEDVEEKVRFKLPNIASEVITCDVAQINEKLSSDSALLDKLYAFLESPPPLNPLLTSFFSKAFGVLISRRPEQNWYSYQYTCLQVIEYIKSKPKFTELLLTHLGTSAVMDLLLRLITYVEGNENKQNILTWLNEEKLIQRVLSLFSPDGGGSELGSGCRLEQHDNAGQLLVEIIRSCRDSQLITPPAEKFPNPLLATAESVDTVQSLLAFMLDSPSPVESVIVNTVDVLLSLLEVRRPAPQGGFYPYTSEPETVNCQADIERQEGVVRSTVECLVPRLPQLTALLLAPPPKPSVTTTAGVLTVPLGKSRLAIAKLLAALLYTHSPSLNSALAEANTLTVLLDLFFEYSLNNFLHAQVEACIRSVIFWSDKTEKTDPDTSTAQDTTPPVESSSLETPKVEIDSGESKEESVSDIHPLEMKTFENPALIHLLTNAKLLDRLISVWSTPSVPPTVAYMGHVTRISNELVTACGLGEDTQLSSLTTPPAPAASCQSRTLLLQLLAQLPEETQESWRGIVSGKLAEINKINEVKPATDEKRIMSSDDEDSEFRDIQFPQDSVLEKMFSDYQMQEMSENFIDSFGFQDDEFTDSDMNISRGMRKLNNVNLTVQTSGSKQEIFDSVCEQRIKTFRSSPDPQDEEEDDPWADKTTELSFSGAAASQQQDRVGDAGAGDSSDEDNEAAPDKMEVDNDQDPWDMGSSGGVAMDTSSSPWDTPTAASSAGSATEAGWADFGAFGSSNDSGSSDIIEKQQSEVMGVEDRPEDDGGESWEPSMASSPEATMLDCSQEDAEENETTETKENEDLSDRLKDVGEAKCEDKSDKKKEGDESEGSLEENFDFLSKRGMIASDNVSNTTDAEQSQKKDKENTKKEGEAEAESS